MTTPYDEMSPDEFYHGLLLELRGIAARPVQGAVNNERAVEEED